MASLATGTEGAAFVYLPKNRGIDLYIEKADAAQLLRWEKELAAEYENIRKRNLNLDLTRGKPSSLQLDLANGLDGILAGDYISADGTDTRNYGGLDGIQELRQLGADLLGVKPAMVLAGGNSSLGLMHQCVHFAYLFGTHEGARPWKEEGKVKFICPVPGYDRHFAICQELGIEMLNVGMRDDGPDMDEVEILLRKDPLIRGLWVVPKYSNPTGIVFSDAVVERMAALGRIASNNFRLFWDNAYAVHDLHDNPPLLANIMDYCDRFGTADSVLQFTSTSKISFAGAGVAFLAASAGNLAKFRKHLGIATIGPDKVNQLRHAKMFPDIYALKQHMKKHAEMLRPKFAAVIRCLEENFADTDLGHWQVPGGGYFVSFDARPGVASEVVRLAAAAGVKLTPAGATFPYGRDPEDKNIRLAPSLPVLDEVEKTMVVFVNCVKLASVRKQLDSLGTGG